MSGANVQSIVTTPDHPFAIAVDRPEGKVYWTAVNQAGIHRSNLDGTDVEDVVTNGLVAPTGLALDLVRGKFYWTDQTLGVIRRADLDGSNVEDVIVSGLATPMGLAIDPRDDGKLYWAEYGGGKIRRANLDGTSIEDIVTPASATPSRVALDLLHDKVYWVTIRIERADLDGSNVETVVDGGGATLEGVSLALDAADDKLYWTRTLYPNVRINRCALDGSANVLLHTESGQAMGIALLLRPGDADRDGDVDLVDYDAFSDCMEGPGLTPEPLSVTLDKCIDTFDFDADGDVDLEDAARLTTAFTG